jgi:hypothetical protein
MYSTPIGVVPKPHSTKFRMVVDQSAEPHSQNSMIPRGEGAIKLDNMHDLGSILLRVHRLTKRARLLVWKSDVSRAYRLMPMHPLWQIKQVATIDGHRHVNRCNHFGNRAAGRVWGTFMSLVLWIAAVRRSIEDLLAYVDDVFSWEFADRLIRYSPYNKLMPAKQVRLLKFWDELGIPHEERKQEFGTTLTIIGFDVDPNALTITMPFQARTDLVTALRSFAHPGSRRSLHDFQSIAGWVNWSLNSFPLLRPGLSVLYAKMAGKSNSHQLIWVSVALCRELLWLADHIEKSDGVHLLQSVEWMPDEADLSCFSDACPTGMAFWFPSLSLGFQCHVDDPRAFIFFFEAYAVLSALSHLAFSLTPRPRRAVVYTDNTNTVDMFNTLHALPQYNPILLTAVDILQDTRLPFHVLHVSGRRNIVADALSRFDNHRASLASPGISVRSFTPPRLTLGATKL